MFCAYVSVPVFRSEGWARSQLIVYEWGVSGQRRMLLE